MTLPALPPDYLERTYAGVLGKIIGVYLGRPFEQWSHERIERELGEIRWYVHERRGAELIVADDDISGTFGFFRALTDNGCRAGLTPRQIGEAWLNYIIEGRTILWWGGIGTSTEHTAYHRLANGVPAPRSGSSALNGRVVAEQIGGQIFCDAWGLLHPGDPEAAAEFARRAASVSHDGTGIHGAQVVAALVAGAFGERDIGRLIDTALARIPAGCELRRMVDDVRGWHAAEPRDWRANLRRIQEQYGYGRYKGGCHMIPNHALIQLALLHGGGDFSESLMIVNTAGYDTDCNSGNVGCILGVLNGLGAMGAGPDWRGPVADRLFLPTADGGGAVTDAVRESLAIVNAARALRGLPALAPKCGARFHFSLPGSVQGFMADDSPDARGTLALESVAAQPDDPASHALVLRYSGIAPGRPARAFTATFTPPNALAAGGYSMSACPTLYPGNTVRARVLAAASNASAVDVRLVLKVYTGDRSLRLVEGPAVLLGPAAQTVLEWTIPELEGHPVAAVGVGIGAHAPASGTLVLDWLDWRGAPRNLSLMPCASGDIWQRAWVPGVSRSGNWRRPPCIDVFQDHGRGLLIQGTRDWRDYAFDASLCVYLAKAAGIAVRVQGMRRYYALLFADDGRARLVKCIGGVTTVLAEAQARLEPHELEAVTLAVAGRTLRAALRGRPLLEATDADDSPLDGGAVALVLEEGSMSAGGLTVKAAG